MGKRGRRKGSEPDDAIRALAGVPTSPADGGASTPDDPAAADVSGSKGKDATATGDGPPPLEPDARLREVSLLVEEVDYVYQLYRWIMLTGQVPKAQEWLKKEPWPHPDYVIDVFGSWEKFLGHAHVTGSPLLARLRAADAAEKDMAAARKQVEKELARVEDLRRQAQTARHAREAAEDARNEERARADRLQRALDAADARAGAAEDKLHERTVALRDAGDAHADPSQADTRVAAVTDELEAVRAHREELLRQVEELREQAVQDARSLNRLSTLLAELAPEDGDKAPGTAPADAAPATVLEAVERAAAAAVHLRFTPDAFTSADDSPYRRPAEIVSTLAVLDDLAALHADPDGFGRSLTQAATERGLNYKHDVSETARSRHPHEYSTTIDGHRVDLGPHVALGSGSGAGFIARIYLHVADGSGEVPRGMYVGHVGRHLPDTTT
ncbi:Chromosome partition protein Smc [Paraconexibacter sp. AEG42_29]|uniref:Chromosome partition protein Smc n=1 Tax=Paraconexibacter sp. AEG42_29 TaxID=2997339 RepID=A0AAU7AUX4_9ACTN